MRQKAVSYISNLADSKWQAPLLCRLNKSGRHFVDCDRTEDPMVFMCRSVYRTALHRVVLFQTAPPQVWVEPTKWVYPSQMEMYYLHGGKAYSKQAELVATNCITRLSGDAGVVQAQQSKPVRALVLFGFFMCGFLCPHNPIDPQGKPVRGRGRIKIPPPFLSFGKFQGLEKEVTGRDQLQFFHGQKSLKVLNTF